MTALAGPIAESLLGQQPEQQEASDIARKDDEQQATSIAECILDKLKCPRDSRAQRIVDAVRPKTSEAFQDSSIRRGVEALAQRLLGSRRLGYSEVASVMAEAGLHTGYYWDTHSPCAEIAGLPMLG